MADEQIVTNIVAKADFSNLIADLHRVTAALSAIQETTASTNRSLAAQIDAINRTFEQNLRKTGQFSTHFVSLASDVDKFGRNLDSGRLKLRDYFRVYQDHVRTSGGLIRDLAQQQVQLQNAILQPLGRNAQGLMQFNVNVPRGLDVIKNKTALARQELQIYNKVIQDGGIQLINWGKNTQWAGRQLSVGLTLPLVAFGRAAAQAFMTADQELTRLTKVYGGLAATSKEELNKVRKDVAATAKELAAGYGASFKDTLSLAADIAATGKQGNELIGSIKETTRLAVLGEVDRQDAMKATLALQSAFKQNTEELSQSIDFLNAVENQTSTTLQDLITAIPKAGPVIEGLGGNVKDLALYLTAMREGGIQAGEAANALKSGLASLINPTKVAQEKFTALGINLKGIVTQNAGNLTDTLLALQSALDKLNPLQKQQALEQLFGKFQFSRMNALFENLGKQGSQTLQVLDLMKASTSDLANIANRELALSTESASGRFKRAMESLRADLASTGDQFLNIGTKLINILDKILNFANKLPDPVKKLGALAGIFTAIAGPVIMLTGLFANFIGYLVKGYGHVKAFLRGGEGFRLLTPEILAAEKAGSLVEKTFYSDAKAAASLSAALKTLTLDYNALNLAINEGRISVNPAISTIGGTVIQPGGGAKTGYRKVDINNPLVSGMASTHINPRDPNNPATLFGLVPGSDIVNLKIGRTPQIMMTQRLPNVEGLTSVSKMYKGQKFDVSTGVVAEESARYHALMATLGMQGKQEIETLKKDIMDGRAVSADFMATFDDILPITTRLTQNAATQSAAIVAELKAGKITVEDAKAQIIAVNATLERDMGIQISQYAAATGRTIDVTKIPLLDQPVVDPVTGKSNMRALFRRERGGKKSVVRTVMEALGRATRTRTMGAPYSIETTMPKFNTGGSVFYNDGDQVPGPNVNADVVPAMLTPGEFVIRRGVAQQDPEGMRLLNSGQGMVVPLNKGGNVPGVQYKFAGGNILRILSALGNWSRASVGSARRVYESAANPSTRTFREAFSYGPTAYSALERRRSPAWQGALGFGQRKPGEVLAHVITNKYLSRFKNYPTQGSAPVMTGEQMLSQFGAMPGGGTAAKRYQLLPDNIVNVSEDFNKALARGNATGSMWLSSNRQPQHLVSLISHLLNSGVPYPVAYRVAYRVLNRINNAMSNLKNVNLSETKWGNIVDNAMEIELSSLKRSYEIAAGFSFNKGGKVPGYAVGGGIKTGYLYGRALRQGLLAEKVLPKSYLLKALGARIQTRPGGKGYEITSLPTNPNLSMFKNLGLSPNGEKILYNSMVETVLSARPKSLDVNVKRGFGPNDYDTLWHSSLAHALWTGNLSKEDKAILSTIEHKVATMSDAHMPDIIRARLFGRDKIGRVGKGLNRGGMVPGNIIGRSMRRNSRYASGVQSFIAGGPVLKLLASLLGSVLVSEGGARLGSKIGGTPGSVITGISQFAPFMMMGSGLGSLRGSTSSADMFATRMGLMGGGFKGGKSVFADLEKVGPWMAKASTEGQGLKKVFANLLLGVTKFRVGILGTVGIAITLFKTWQNYKKTQANSAAEFGFTADQASKAGLKYTSYADKVAKAAEAQKLFRTQAEMAYKSMASAGTPFNLTISEYEKLRKELKDTMQAQIDMLNAVKNQDLSRVAVQLKLQFMAAGLSAEEATKKVYTLLQLSNKASQTIQTITTKSFMEITTPQQAAAKSVESFSYAKQFENAKDAAFAFNTALEAIDNSISDTYEKNKKDAKQKKQNFNETKGLYDAEQSALSNINSKVKNQAVLGADVLKQLAAQNPEIKKILNSQDTVVSAWQKIKLAAMGYMGTLDDLNAKQTNLLYKLTNAVSQTVEAQNKTGVLKDQYSALDRLQRKYDSLDKASKGQTATQEINAKNAIKALDEQIKKINDAADARKKALDEETQGQNMALEIQKKRAEYEQKVAAGDFTGAATAQLDLQQLLNEQQNTIATQQIEAARQTAVAPLEARKKALEDAQQNLADSAAIASESLDSVTKQLQAQKDKISAVNNAMTAYKVAQLTGSKDINNAAAVLIDALKKSGVKVDEFTTKYVGTSLVTEKLDPKTVADNIMKGLSGIDQILAQSDIKINQTTGDIYINGEKLSVGKGTSGNPYKGGSATEAGIDLTSFLGGWDGTPGPGSARQKVKKFASEKGYKPGEYFTLTTGNVSDGTLKTWTFRVEKDNNITNVSRKALGGITDGKISGPGTGTSDSILARLSNGEYVTKATSVSSVGVDNMHLINMLGAGGVIRAAANLISGKALGGYIPGYKDAGLVHSYSGSPMFNPFAMGMEWFGNTLRSAANSVSKFALGFDPSTPFSKQSGMEKFAMASMLIPGAEGTIKGTSTLSKVIPFLNKTKTKDIINSIYKTKYITQGRMKFPTHVLSGSDTRFAFQGHGEDLSQLLLSGKIDKIIPTTPEGILEYALTLNPKNKEIQSLLDNFKNKSITQKEIEFLDKMNAAVSINNRGNKTQVEQSEGLVMLLASLKGDKNATNIIDTKTKLLPGFIAAEKIARDKQISEEFAKFSPKEGPIDINSVPVIHSTKYPIVKDKAGNIILYPYAQHNLGTELAVPRASLHFTLEDSVKSHMFGNWENVENKIVSPLSSMIKDSGLPYQLNSTDTWWMRNPGQALKLSNASVIRPFTNESMYTNELISRGLLKAGEKIPEIMSDPATKEVLHMVRGNESDAGMERQALQLAKNLLGIDTGLPLLEQHGLSGYGAQDHINRIAKALNLSNEIHSGSTPEILEKSFYKFIDSSTNGQFNTNKLSWDSIEAIREVARHGGFKTNIKTIKPISGIASGGYINPSYNPNMKMPSYASGVKYLYNDTIAQLHKGEAVVPQNMNPWNAAATNPIGGGTYYIQPTINAAPGMDENMITDLAVQKVMTQLKTIDRKAGGNINMNNRYSRAGGIR